MLRTDAQGMFSKRAVLAGLVPAIHASALQQCLQEFSIGAAWMAGTSPAKTDRWRLRPPTLPLQPA